jgi:hypothetical protein
LNSPRISAYEIHEWIYGYLQITVAVVMIPIHGPKRHVHIKLTVHVHEFIRKTGGQVAYIHVDGTRSQIKIDVAEIGTKAIRIANIPPEVPDEVAALIAYGTIVAIRN